MKLKSLREHYQSTDGINWTPKRGFNSEEEIREARFFAGRWRAYQCGFCNKYHVADIEKKNKDNLDDR